jgi:hypothetical protein
MTNKFFKSACSKIFIINFYTFTKIENLIIWINNSRYKNIDKNKYPAKAVIIDFSKCKPTIKPYHITPLACIIHEYQSKGYTIRLKNIPTNIESYLDSFNFQQFSENASTIDIPVSLDCKILPLWLIKRNTYNLYPGRAKEYFENNHFDGLSLWPLSISLAELMNNIFDHSDSTIPGYTFTQYNSTQESIITCVCDFGVGIPVKVNNFLKTNGRNKLPNVDALLKAFEMNFSTKSQPHNKGYGLDNIISNIKLLQSKALIISNNVIYRILPDDKEDTYELTVNFPGSLFVIWLNANNLSVKEEEFCDEASL